MSASMERESVWRIVGWSTEYHKDSVSCYVIARKGDDTRDFRFFLGDDVRSFVANSQNFIKGLNDEERSSSSGQN